MARVIHRDVAPFFQKVRNFLLGREHTNALRFEDLLADRTTPPPQIPDGPAHKLSANYYVLRDGRRLVAHPINLASSNLIGSGTESAASKLPTPGSVYKWD